MFRARSIGVACAFQVLGRSRRSIRRLRRATFSCLLVFTRNVLPSQSFWLPTSKTLLGGTDISSVLLTRRAANALVLGLAQRPLVGAAAHGAGVQRVGRRAQDESAHHDVRQAVAERLP